MLVVLPLLIKPPDHAMEWVIFMFGVWVGGCLGMMFTLILCE